MSDDVYYNEPGHEREAGTVESDRKNEAYSNIVKYCNIKFAMIDQIKGAHPKGIRGSRQKTFLSQEGRDSRGVPEVD